MSYVKPGSTSRRWNGFLPRSVKTWSIKYMNLIAENQLDIKAKEGVYMGVDYDGIPI
jgi:hypothetical protein